MKNEKFYKLLDNIKIALFAGIILIFFVIGLLFFLRPAVSEVEKRELNDFPYFSIEGIFSEENVELIKSGEAFERIKSNENIEALFAEMIENAKKGELYQGIVTGQLWNDFTSGKLTSDISLWYADTFPIRETMINVNFALKNLYGIRDEQISEEAYVKNDTAYQYYGFVKTESDRYVKFINQFKASVGNNVTVYDLVAPLHYQIAPNKDELMSMNPNADNGKDQIKYMYSNLSSGIKTVDAFSQIEAHNNEYLYYRTDHHWTARGAYYAYVAFCQAKGITPTPLPDYERLQFNGFLGTLYADNGKPADMAANPDYVEAFVPNGTNTLYVYTADGNRTKFTGGVVRKDTNSFYPLPGSKYNCFLTSDNPLETELSYYCKIENPNIQDGSSIVVIKESYGNAFVPFLVDSYQYVYIIDYRYWSGNLADFVIENEIKDVLFLNVINVTSTEERMDQLDKIIN